VVARRPPGRRREAESRDTSVSADTRRWRMMLM
jgi:hypothetical protein